MGQNFEAARNIMPARSNAAYSLARYHGRPLTKQVRDIIGIKGNPVLRNLLITQCYHDLSTGLAELLSGGNANWCTFATWASKTAGCFVRKDELPAALRRWLAPEEAHRSTPPRD